MPRIAPGARAPRPPSRERAGHALTADARRRRRFAPEVRAAPRARLLPVPLRRACRPLVREARALVVVDARRPRRAELLGAGRATTTTRRVRAAGSIAAIDARGNDAARGLHVLQPRSPLERRRARVARSAGRRSAQPVRRRTHRMTRHRAMQHPDDPRHRARPARAPLLVRDALRRPVGRVGRLRARAVALRAHPSRRRRPRPPSRAAARGVPRAALLRRVERRVDALRDRRSAVARSSRRSPGRASARATSITSSSTRSRASRRRAST